MSMRSRPAQASIAADPVSPEVAPTIVTRCVALRQHMVEQAAQHLHRHVLEGERRAVEQLLHEQAGFQLDQRHDGRMAEAGIGLVADRLQHLERDRRPDERLHDPRGQFVDKAGRASPASRPG